MADLKKCDRCGKIFEPMKSVQVPVEFGKRDIFPGYITFLRYSDNGAFNQKDLCSFCVEEFREFMRNGKDRQNDK